VFSDRDTRSVALRYGANGLFLFNPGISGSKLANAALHYGFREAEGVFVSTLSRRDWSGLEELAGLIRIKRVLVPYGPLHPELSGALERMAADGAVVGRVWPGDSVSLGGLEVRPDWCGSGSARFKAYAGYSGRGRREGLDWQVKTPVFELSVLNGGARVSVRGGARVPVRVLENRPGRAVEMAL